MPLKRIRTVDQDLSRVQDNVDQALTGIQASVFQSGVMLSGVSLVSGSNSVAHKLGRTPVIWVITDKTANATIYRTASDNKFLTLQASAACTVNVWVA